MKNLIACFFILLFYQSFSQELGIEIDSLNHVLHKELKNNKLKEYADLSHNTSLDYYYKENYTKAIEYALKEVKYHKYISREKYKNGLFNLGLFFFKNKEYSKSIITYNKVIDSFNLDEFTYRAYCENALNFQKLGDYYRAKIYFNKGLTHSDEISTKRLPLIYLKKISLNQDIETNSSLQENTILLKKVDSLSSIIPLNTSELYSLNNEYGRHYGKENSYYDYKKSKNYHLKALKIALGINDSLRISATSNNIATLFNIEKNDSALYYANKSIKFYTLNNSFIPKAYLNKADYYFNQNNSQNGLTNLNKALQLTLSTKIDSSLYYVPNYNIVKRSNDKTLTFLILKEKSRHILESDVKNKDLLTYAYKNIRLTDKLLDFIRTESFEKKSKLFWQKEASQLYTLAVDACSKLKKTDESFYFIEKNKALLLLENIVKNTDNASIPIHLLQKELDLKNKISALENKMENKTNYHILDQYYSLKIKYTSFIEAMSKKYPNHYKLNKPLNLVNLETVKSNLDGDTAILEYILGKKESYVLLITKDEIILTKLNNHEITNTNINIYLKLIANPFVNKSDIKECFTLANKLYNNLFPKNIQSIINTKQKLLIVPDKALQHLAFENLRKKNKYLIEDHELSYVYSLSFLNFNTKIARNAKLPFIGFAPNSFDYDNLQKLPQSIKETNTISKQLNGTSLINKEANKRNFINKIKKYKILHLSTHSNASDSISPWIAFKNEKLYLNELYTIKNQAELVVLNACNSSLGKINNGEGVFSLARAFFYSGANSVVSSLWNVNDKSNTEITISFYSYLKEGKTKSAALRQAKLDYIESHSLSEASPYYWSSLILIGDNSAIELNDNLLINSILGVLFLLFLIFSIKKLKIVGNKS
ncbi:CHAT domain-containing protein [Lacinutrix mariniflava]|uniref:CHAT domain-containing protein n=1 Tax=Lacinutrix mariniflava TaxID=342955 RepID=UPI000ABF21A2|nr:CHAT domain-containing protein [Lacinutrix mariniflava]